ncbi:11996_t:CDS:2, partial [Racocetra persica]
IEAYNSVHDKPNKSLSAFTIRDAIYLAADAWQNVTSNTINKQLDKLNNLIAELPIDNLFNTNEFVHLDDILLIEEMLDDMTLIEQIH